MTGFGTGSFNDEKCSIRVDIRSVNHRYRDLVLHTPPDFVQWEDLMRRTVQEVIFRGRVEIFVSVERLREQEYDVKLNEGLLQGYATSVAAASRLLGQQVHINLAGLLAVPDLFTVESKSEEDAAETLQTALKIALDDLLAMRRLEGQHLTKDLSQRLDLIENWFQEIEERLPTVLHDHRARLESRLEELVSTPDITQERLAAEMVVLTDRSCIVEEIVRAQSHVEHFRQVFAIAGPAGRKLDFLLQELNREVNTMAAKTPDQKTAAIVVNIKTELEKMREQVQNIE